MWRLIWPQDHQGTKRLAEREANPDEDGGIDFKQDEPPHHSDFAYLAFTVGMSFAVAETEPTRTAIRKVVLGHALLCYTFGIVAVTINLVTNLGQS